MNKEIERKFLVSFFDEALAYDKIEIRQGYVFSNEGKVVRIRTWNDKGYITVKYRISKLTRNEFEYEIPKADADIMLDDLCNNAILSKTRYLVNDNNKKWEIDVFHGKNEGLILAEIELNSEDEEFILPSFAGREVTSEAKYSNHNLAKGI